MYQKTVELRGDPTKALERMREALIEQGYIVSGVSGGMITAQFQPKQEEQKNSLSCAKEITVTASRAGLTVEADLAAAIHVAMAIVLFMLVFDAFFLVFVYSTFGAATALLTGALSLAASPAIVFALAAGIRRQFAVQLERLLEKILPPASNNSPQKQNSRFDAH